MEASLFKSKMALSRDTYLTIAKALKITRQTLSNKVEGKQQFKHNEINFLITYWNLTPHEVVQIFFDKE